MIRTNVKQLKNGQWAAFSGAKYFTATVSDTEVGAKVARLHQIGREAQERIDAVDRELEKLGMDDASDPHGYLC
jgi:hypothetical protein